MVPSNYVKIFVFHTSTDIKKWHPRLRRSENSFWEGPWGGGNPKLCQNMCLFKYLLISKKKWCPSLSHSKQ